MALFDQIHRSMRTQMRRRLDAWYGDIPRSSLLNLRANREISRKAEFLASTKILPKEGFVDIVSTSSYNHGFAYPFFDAFAKKNGERYCIQVTLSPTKRIGNAQRRAAISSFLSFFGARFVVCVVHPSFHKYSLFEFEAPNLPGWVIMTRKKQDAMTRFPDMFSFQAVFK